MISHKLCPKSCLSNISWLRQNCRYVRDTSKKGNSKVDTDSLSFTQDLRCVIPLGQDLIYYCEFEINYLKRCMSYNILTA